MRVGWVEVCIGVLLCIVGLLGLRTTRKVRAVYTAASSPTVVGGGGGYGSFNSAGIVTSSDDDLKKNTQKVGSKPLVRGRAARVNELSWYAAPCICRIECIVLKVHAYVEMVSSSTCMPLPSANIFILSHSHPI